MQSALQRAGNLKNFIGDKHGILKAFLRFDIQLALPAHWGYKASIEFAWVRPLFRAL
jgi:hypothetical protein